MPSGVSVGIFDTIDRLLSEVQGYVDDGYVRIKLKIEPGWDVEPVSKVRELSDSLSPDLAQELSRVAKPFVGEEIPSPESQERIVALIVVLSVLGGAVTLITDVMWYDALGRRDVFATRLWAQVALFAIGFGAMLVLALADLKSTQSMGPVLAIGVEEDAVAHDQPVLLPADGHGRWHGP